MTLWTSDRGWQKERKGVRRPKYAYQVPAGELPPAAEVKFWKWPVYEAGDLQACSASAIAAAIELAQQKAAVYRFRPSIAFIYYVSRYLQMKEDEDLGSSIYEGLRGCFCFGFPAESDWAMSSDLKYSDKPPVQAELNARLHGIKTFEHLDRGALGAEDVLQGCKAAINQGYPVLFGAVIDQRFLAGVFDDGRDVRVPGDRTNTHQHAMVAVRYEDDAGGGFFWVRDSLGPQRGDDGYLRIPYQYILDESLSDDFWVVREVSVSDEPDLDLLEKRVKYWNYAAQFAQAAQGAYKNAPGAHPKAARLDAVLQFPPKLSA